MFRVGNLFVGLQHARRAHDQVERYGTTELQVLGEPLQFACVGFRQPLVNVCARGFLAFDRVEGDPRGDATASDALVDFIADLGFEHFQLARKVHGNLALLAINRTQFDRHLEAIPGTFAPAISGHRFHSRLEYGKASVKSRISLLVPQA